MNEQKTTIDTSQQPNVSGQATDLPKQTVGPKLAAPAQQQPEPESSRSYVITWLLSYFVGGWGIDRFYRGMIGTGILKFLTLGGLGVWTFIDWVMIGFGKPLDKQGLVLSGYEDNQKTMKIITGAMLALGLLIIPALVMLCVFLAVPVLQQNTRNTQRKLDAAIIASGIAEFVSQAEGQLPQSISSGESSVSLAICGTGACDGTKVNTSNLGYYNLGSISVQPYSQGINFANKDGIYIISGAKCVGVSGYGQQDNSAAVIYFQEDGSNQYSQQCTGF